MLRLDKYRTQQGQIFYKGSDGVQYVPMETISGLSGIFSKDGFFGKAVQTASGLFRQKDGTNTFVGDAFNTFASSFGEKIGSEVAQKGELTKQGQFLTTNPFSVPNYSVNTLPVTDDKNPLPEDKDNTLIYVGLGLLAIGVPTGIYFWNKSKKESKAKK